MNIGDKPKIIQEIPKNDLLIWTTDNNGQIARPEKEEEGESGAINNAHIGHWHYAKATEKGNGGNW